MISSFPTILKVERTFFQSQNTPAEPASDKDSLPEQSSSTDVTSNGTSSDPTSLTEQADLIDEMSSKEVLIFIPGVNLITEIKS